MSMEHTRCVQVYVHTVEWAVVRWPQLTMNTSPWFLHDDGLTQEFQTWASLSALAVQLPVVTAGEQGRHLDWDGNAARINQL
jgi:hypothetical protein